MTLTILLTLLGTSIDTIFYYAIVQNILIFDIRT